MTMMKIHEDGQDREATAEEVKLVTSETKAFEVADKLKNEALAEKAALKAALLERLKITADEANLLLS